MCKLSNIYVIHPDDSNLKFFKKTIKVLQNKIPLEYVFLGPSDTYHNNFYNTFKNNDHSTLIFFCHGEQKSLRGCNRESAQRHPFFHGNLVSPQHHIDIFNNKNVFCMACYSSTLGKSAIQAGANVFLGFGEIKFNQNYIKSKRVSNFTKWEVRKIMQTALLMAYLNNHSFNKLSLNLKNLFNKRISELILGNDHPDDHVKLQASQLLASIRNGIVMFGDGNQPFIPT